MREPLIGVEWFYHMHQPKRATTPGSKHYCRSQGYVSADFQIMTNNNSF